MPELHGAQGDPLDRAPELAGVEAVTADSEGVVRHKEDARDDVLHKGLAAERERKSDDPEACEQRADDPDRGEHDQRGDCDGRAERQFAHDGQHGRQSGSARAVRPRPRRQADRSGLRQMRPEVNAEKAPDCPSSHERGADPDRRRERRLRAWVRKEEIPHAHNDIKAHDPDAAGDRCVSARGGRGAQGRARRGESPDDQALGERIDAERDDGQENDEDLGGARNRAPMSALWVDRGDVAGEPDRDRDTDQEIGQCRRRRAPDDARIASESSRKSAVMSCRPLQNQAILKIVMIVPPSRNQPDRRRIAAA